MKLLIRNAFSESNIHAGPVVGTVMHTNMNFMTLMVLRRRASWASCEYPCSRHDCIICFEPEICWEFKRESVSVMRDFLLNSITDLALQWNLIPLAARFSICNWTRAPPKTSDCLQSL